MNRRFEFAPVLAAGATYIGARLGESRSGASGLGVLAIGLTTLLAGLLVIRGPSVLRAVVVGCALALLGAGMMSRAVAGVDNHPLRALADGHRATELEATVAADPSFAFFTADVVLRVGAVRPSARFPWAPVRATRVLAHFDRDGSTRARALEIGDRVTVFGRLAPLDGFDRRRRWEHVAAAASDAELLSVRANRNPLWRVANGLRNALARGAEGLPADDRALLAGFLVGDTRNISDRTKAEFRDSGLSHLLAVSGANVAFVLAMAAPILRRGDLRRRFVVTVLILVVFGAVTRFLPSVLRAECMAAVAALGALIGRPADALRRLAYAVIALLLIDPFLTHSVSFGLSVGASAGIVTAAAPIQGWLRGPEAVRAALAVTIAAQIGALPVALATFGNQPAVAPIANLLAVPAAEPLTVVGLVATSTVAIGGSIARFMLWPVLGMLSWVRFVAAVGAKSPVRMGRPALVVVAMVIALARLRRRPEGRAERGGSLAADERVESD